MSFLKPFIATKALFLLVLSLSTTSTYAENKESHETEGNYIRFELKAQESSAYHKILYEVTARQEATALIHSRYLPVSNETQRQVALLTDEESQAFFDSLRALRPLEMEDQGPIVEMPQQLTWTCTVKLDGKENRFQIKDPANVEDPRYFALFQLVRGNIDKWTDPIPFRNVFSPRSSRGWLNIESVPSARVFINDFDTQETTPLYSYSLQAGEHEILLRSIDGKYERSIRAKLEPQGTTTLRVDLR